MILPPKWTNVYPHGSREGDEEMAFFCVLARNKWEWVSTSHLVKESGLTRQVVERIISKYLTHNPPLVFKSTNKDDHWAYWERVPELLSTPQSLGKVDQDIRINKQYKNYDPSRK